LRADRVGGINEALISIVLAALSALLRTFAGRVPRHGIGSDVDRVCD
jgi:hypothetical protein